MVTERSSVKWVSEEHAVVGHAFVSNEAISLGLILKYQGKQTLSCYRLTVQHLLDSKLHIQSLKVYLVK